MTEPMNVNFSKLKERLLAVNHPELGHYQEMKDLLCKLVELDTPTLLLATGGSKVVAYYLEYILERIGKDNLICTVIEPRDFFYQPNIKNYKNLVAISASGKTNGIKEALEQFSGNCFLICEHEQNAPYSVVSWSTEKTEKEHSFTSLLTSLAPMTLMLDATTSLDKILTREEIEKINDTISSLLEKSEKRSTEEDFSHTRLVQIMSGIDTKPSSSILESNLTETGIAIPIVHDKGSFCHGRSNLLYQYPDSKMIYLSHKNSEFDNLLIDILTEQYHNVSIFSPATSEPYWQEYELMLQMYYLSKKIASDKNMDVTKPAYNKKLVKTLYQYRGRL